jgi:hypothetical protein
MASEGEVHGDVRAIEGMHAATERLTRSIGENLAQVEREMGNLNEGLVDARVELKRRQAVLREAIANAEEDDDAAYERRELESTEEQLVSLERQRRRLDEAHKAFRTHARQAGELVESHGPRAKKILDDAAADLKAYLGKSIEAPPLGLGSASAGRSALSSNSYDGLSEQPSGDVTVVKHWADSSLHPNRLNLSPEERRALADHQHLSFADTNPELRSRNLWPVSVTKNVTLIDGVMSRSRIPVPLRLYRGVDKAEGDKWENYGVRVEFAYGSTALAREAAHRRHTLIEIDVPAGANAVYLDTLYRDVYNDIVGVRYGDEVEVLLDRNQIFLVTEVQWLSSNKRIIRAKMI